MVKTKCSRVDRPPNWYVVSPEFNIASFDTNREQGSTMLHNPLNVLITITQLNALSPDCHVQFLSGTAFSVEQEGNGLNVFQRGPMKPVVLKLSGEGGFSFIR